MNPPEPRLSAAPSRGRALPLLICCDLQQEYLAAGRRHAVRNGEAPLAACRRVLEAWRRDMGPIVHMKRVARAAWFNPASTLTDWIAGFRPQPGDLVFEHPLPSAYSSPRFADYLTNLGPLECYLIGFSLEETILSTAVEGFHRGQMLTFVSNAVGWCGPREAIDPHIYHSTIVGLVARFAEVKTEEQALAAVG
jgi:nicotinamidase-related amidase